MKNWFTKKYNLLGLLLAVSCTVSAQQEPQYTQFVFNKLAFNPGFAGSHVSPTITAIYRNQWIGIKGAPNTQVLSYNQPFLGERLGFGATLTRNSIGITRSVTADIAYCYRIKMRRGHLGIGIQFSPRNITQSWNDDRLYTPTPAGTDIAIPIENTSKWVINFGAGMYYKSDKWFAGFAIPRIVKNNIDFVENGSVLSREEWHLNGIGGVNIKAADNLVITPQLLLKYVPHAPFDAELNVGAMLMDKFYGGVGYRVGGDTGGAGESVDILAGIKATTNLFFCLSYDIGLTRLRKFSNGTIEATIRWDFNPPEGGEVIKGIDY